MCDCKKSSTLSVALMIINFNGRIDFLATLSVSSSSAAACCRSITDLLKSPMRISVFMFRSMDQSHARHHVIPIGITMRLVKNHHRILPQQQVTCHLSQKNTIRSEYDFAVFPDCTSIITDVVAYQALMRRSCCLAHLN